MTELLKKINACSDAIIWAECKSWNEIYNTCHRGDWLLWLFKKTNPDDIRLLTLAKGHCANTVRHLMKDERSVKAVDTAIAFGEGEVTIEELSNATATAAFKDADATATAAAIAAAATTAYFATATVDAAKAAKAAAAAATTAYFAATTAYFAGATAAATAATTAYFAAVTAAAAADDDADAAAANAAARKENQLLTANIVRKFIPIEKFNI